MDAQPLKTLAELVSAQMIGPSDVAITFALPLQDVVPGAITFASSAEQVAQLKPENCGAVIVAKPFDDCAVCQLVVPHVREAFEKILRHLRRPPTPQDFPDVAETAFVADSASLGKNVKIGHGAYIGANSTIGDNCIIHPNVYIDCDCQVGCDTVIRANVTVYQGTLIGQRVSLHAGCVLGAHGFGYQPVDGRHEKTGQFGWVELGDDVEIGANTTVDRGTYGPTLIGEGTKIDNLVQIGHNCQLGKHNLICAQVGIAGSTSIGDYVVLGGQVGIKDHVRLGDHINVGAQSGIMKDVESGETVFGSPAIHFKRKMLEVAAVSKLPELRTILRDLEKQVSELQTRVEANESASEVQPKTKAA